MGLENFIEQWKELGDVSKAVNSMLNNRDNPDLFGDSYNKFRAQVSKPYQKHPFPKLTEFDEQTRGFILSHAGPYAQSIEEYSLIVSRNNLGAILDGLKTKLGDDNLINYIMNREIRVDEPKSFVDKLRSFKQVLRPLSRDNSQPGEIKSKLVEKIDEVVRANPDEKTKIIAKALKGIYGIEKAAASTYMYIFVKPKLEQVKAAINDGNEWIDYMRANLDKHTIKERIEFYSDIYARLEKDK